MDLPWYELVSPDAPIDQGDLIFDCPVVGWKDGPVELSTSGDTTQILRSAIELAKVDVVTMTQTCDLAQRKVHFVILCPHYPLPAYRQAWEENQKARGQNPTEKAWKRHLDDILAGQLWNLSMLNSE